MLVMPCNPVRYEVPFFLLVCWTGLAEHSKASGTEPTLCLAHATQDWKHGLILPGKAVSAGWGTGREVGEKGWHEFPFSPATMGALGNISAHTLHWYKALPPHHPNSHCYQTRLIQKPHWEPPRNIHKPFFLFQRNCKFGYICEQVTFAVCQPCWEWSPLHIKQVTLT